MTTIRMEGMTKVFGGGASSVKAVNNISLEVQAGELFFLLGPSGCGKTTLLRMVAGMDTPTSGRVWFGNREVTHAPIEQRGTALVFQNYALWPHMTVQRNVEFGPKMQGFSRRKREEMGQRALLRTKMQECGQRKPNQLSGGQQQRVALARALASGAAVLLLDEPLSNLDAQLRLHMREELSGLIKSSSTTALYVTHDQKEAISMADRIAVMNVGEVVQIGRPEEIYDRPQTRFVAEFLGEANIVAGRVAAVDGVVTVDTDDGPLYAANTTPVQSGQKVNCCIRPERISLTAGDTIAAKPGRAVFSAKVMRTVYLGDSRNHLCRLPSGRTWKTHALAGREGDAGDGQSVSLTVGAEDVTILPD